MINDQFTVLRGLVSRQRIKQLRYKAMGRCIICGARKYRGARCLRHYTMHKEAENRRHAKIRQLRDISASI